jgi:hypothetical protein
MKSLENIETLFAEIHSKPAMFWGGGKHPFTSLVAFLAGYKMGSGTAPDSPITADKLIPHSFHDFVAHKMCATPTTGGKGWPTLIREATTSEEEAFELFFRLRAEYEVNSTGQP